MNMGKIFGGRCPPYQSQDPQHLILSMIFLPPLASPYKGGEGEYGKG